MVVADAVLKQVGEIVSAGRKRVFIGVSNGAVAAVASALEFGADGVWLASGVPCAEHIPALAELTCPIVATTASHEVYWGGARGIVAAMPSATQVFRFRGRHAREPRNTIEQVLEYLRDTLGA